MYYVRESLVARSKYYCLLRKGKRRFCLSLLEDNYLKLVDQLLHL